ncbi:hypothetical protein B566_EDAN004883 [Ephemera danica]|nr:hypothetical protein B566_EDAN004883 [Ephemera danica]
MKDVKGYTGPRCDRAELLELAGCPPGSVYQRGSSALREVYDEPFSDFQKSDGERSYAVQVRPQKAKLALRAGGAGVNLTLQFRGALNYPLDVYYLMDLTVSMRDDKDTLASLVGDLTNALSNLTENFRLGFGSYVDKPVMPFVDQVKLTNPCSVEHGVCSPAYGFQHRQRLSRDTTQFKERVNEAPISGNLDNAEGGLDALMQTIVCNEHIGWAPDARKIVMLVTDGIMHFAGDGKLGGAIQKNDGKCHLDSESGLYTLSNVMDYPSLAEVDRTLLENKINVIFAVTKERLVHYTRLSDVLEASALVAALEKDSSNIIQLVRQGYQVISCHHINIGTLNSLANLQEIVSSIVFRDNVSAPLRISYTTTCRGSEIAHESSSCEDTREGEQYEFDLQLHLDTCPDDPEKWRQRIDVSERGLVEGLELDVELLCGCSCAKEQNSPSCNGHGNLDCGVCDCHVGWYGPTCSCTGQNATTILDLEQNCLPAAAALDGAELCSGQGDCVCGRCECHGEAYGTYCQCDDSLCDRWGVNGERCGGPGRGRCVCGKCECEPGWSGASCSCDSDSDKCIAPGDSKPCSGQGQCVCGQCICGASDDGSRYTGTFCEKCDTCRGLCELYKSCVLCKAFNSTCSEQPGVDLCHTNTGNAYIDLVPELYVSEEKGEEMCVFNDPQDGCQFRFSYRVIETRRASLRVLQHKTCSYQVNTARYAGTIVALIVLAGLVFLLCWRGVVETKDRIAYQRFQADTRNTMFEAGENPLFKPATTYYAIPQGYEGPKEPPTSPTLTTPRTPLATTPF